MHFRFTIISPTIQVPLHLPILPRTHNQHFLDHNHIPLQHFHCIDIINHHIADSRILSSSVDRQIIIKFILHRNDYIGHLQHNLVNHSSTNRSLCNCLHHHNSLGHSSPVRNHNIVADHITDPIVADQVIDRHTRHHLVFLPHGHPD